MFNFIVPFSHSHSLRASACDDTVTCLIYGRTSWLRKSFRVRFFTLSPLHRSFPPPAYRCVAPPPPDRGNFFIVGIVFCAAVVLVAVIIHFPVALSLAKSFNRCVRKDSLLLKNNLYVFFSRWINNKTKKTQNKIKKKELRPKFSFVARSTRYQYH